VDLGLLVNLMIPSVSAIAFDVALDYELGRIWNEVVVD
jgi:hypothetical protein